VESGTLRLGPGFRKKTFVRLTLESHVLAGVKTPSHTTLFVDSPPLLLNGPPPVLSYLLLSGPPVTCAKQSVPSPRPPQRRAPRTFDELTSHSFQRLPVGWQSKSPLPTPTRRVSYGRGAL
jgi:hypothetical protein